MSESAQKKIMIRNDEISELSYFDAALLAFFVGEPRDVLRPHPERCLSVEAVALRGDAQPPDGPPVTNQESDTQGLYEERASRRSRPKFSRLGQHLGDRRRRFRRA